MHMSADFTMTITKKVGKETCYCYFRFWELSDEEFLKL